jgi:hypothetical protein
VTAVVVGRMVQNAAVSQLGVARDLLSLPKTTSGGTG